MQREGSADNTEQKYLGLNVYLRAYYMPPLLGAGDKWMNKWNSTQEETINKKLERI